MLSKTPTTEKDSLQVLLLCGGRGERLKPLTENVPKPLIRINDRPIIAYLLSYFKAKGFRDFVIAAGYKAEAFEAYFSRHHRDLNIEIVDSGDVDIIRRIQDAARLLKGDFIACYGDTLADVDIDGLVNFHTAHSGEVTITSYPLQSQFGIFELDTDGRILSFVEKPVLDRWINIGYFYFEAGALARLRSHDAFVDYLQDVSASGQAYSFRHRGVHITVNTITELHDAEKNISLFLNNGMEPGK